MAAPQPVSDSGPFANLLDTNRFEHMWRVATAFSQSALIPEHFRGKPADCFVGLQMAIRLGIDPFMFLQSCYVVHGKPGIEAKMAIALANNSGKLHGPIQYELSGDGNMRQCTAYAIMRETGEKVSMTVDWATVVAEGWLAKAGSKWKTMPDVMFRYRAAMWLIRTHFPEVILGLQSAEELDDTESEIIQGQQPLRLKPNSLSQLAQDLTTPRPAPTLLGSDAEERQSLEGDVAPPQGASSGQAAGDQGGAGEPEPDMPPEPQDEPQEPQGSPAPGMRPEPGSVARTCVWLRQECDTMAGGKSAYDRLLAPDSPFELTEEEKTEVTAAWMDCQARLAKTRQTKGRQGTLVK